MNKPTTKTLGEPTRTNRGFPIIQFSDLYGGYCTLQASSLAENLNPGTSAIWLGIGDDRMHLDRDQVQALVNHLQAWLKSDEGRFDV